VIQDQTELLLWQGDATKAPVHDNILLWQGIAERAGSRSLTEYLEDHGGEVRRRYLAWSYDLGETRVMGRPLRRRLRALGAGSLWPHAMFAEQSTWKQDSLEKILKVLALDLLLETEVPASLAFAGADRDLSRVLEAICRERQVRYSWLALPARRVSARPDWRRRLPQALLGLTAPIYFLLRRRGLPAAPQARSRPGARRLLLCGPFINHSADAAAKCEFVSQYWTELPPLLAREGYELLWLHLFYPHPRIPSATVAAQTVARIARDAGASEDHAFVDAYFSVPGLVRLLARWSVVALESVVVGACLRARFALRPRESFWPLLRTDWARAFRGIECAVALYYLECFERALARIAHQDEGLYLMENQGWERALIRAWRRHAHGRLTGVAHSTLRFWDLRYHCDPRRYQPGRRAEIPEPDAVAVNGVQARREFLATCASRERVIDCEALRYLTLARHAPREPRRRPAGQPLRLLVLGDFLADSTARLLRLVEEALPPAGQPPEIWIKAHPNCPVEAGSLAGLRPRIVHETVASLVPAVDVVLASNTTSAALEAYIGNACVLVYDDRSGVNFSPLRSVREVLFVHHALELRRALQAAGEAQPRAASGAADFFHIDVALPRWRAYLLGHDRRCSTPVGQHACKEDIAT
jgi:surface carbohydrate biosynthesis protein (TIGR04326 family)